MDDDGCESLPTCFFEFVQTVVQTIFRVGLTQVLKPLPSKELSLGLLETHTELLIQALCVLDAQTLRATFKGTLALSVGR